MSNYHAMPSTGENQEFCERCFKPVPILPGENGFSEIYAVGTVTIIKIDGKSYFCQATICHECNWTNPGFILKWTLERRAIGEKLSQL